MIIFENALLIGLKKCFQNVFTIIFWTDFRKSCAAINEPYCKIFRKIKKLPIWVKYLISGKMLNVIVSAVCHQIGHIVKSCALAADEYRRIDRADRKYLF